MAHEHWNIECGSKGHRATVKIWPTGRHQGRRYRMLKSSWRNTGSRVRDYSLGQDELRLRLRELERQWDAELKGRR